MDTEAPDLLDLIAELHDSQAQRCDVQEMLVYQDDLTGRLQAVAKVTLRKQPWSLV